MRLARRLEGLHRKISTGDVLQRPTSSKGTGGANLSRRRCRFGPLWNKADQPAQRRLLYFMHRGPALRAPLLRSSALTVRQPRSTFRVGPWHASLDLLFGRAHPRTTTPRGHRRLRNLFAVPSRRVSAGLAGKTPLGNRVFPAGPRSAMLLDWTNFAGFPTFPFALLPGPVHRGHIYLVPWGSGRFARSQLFWNARNASPRQESPLVAFAGGDARKLARLSPLACGIPPPFPESSKPSREPSFSRGVFLLLLLSASRSRKHGANSASRIRATLFLGRS